MNRLRYLNYGVLLVICVFVFSGITYAYKSYSIGDEVTYNDIKFYVIKDSSSDEDSITLLKAEPLTVDEVNRFGVGHINKYTESSIGEVYDNNGYGGMAYYSSETCGYVNGNGIDSGCTTDFEKSDAKYLLDAWSVEKIGSSNLAKDSTGYSVRLIMEDELLNVGYYYSDSGELRWENAPNWIHEYSTITLIEGYISGKYLKYISTIGYLNSTNVDAPQQYRPVITLKKSAIEKEDEDKTDKNIPENDKKEDNINNEIKDTVNVPNTLQKISVITIMIGVIIISISTIIILKLRFRR